MRKACFALSAIIHALFISLICRISFPVKIIPPAANIINIFPRQPDELPQPQSPFPGFPAEIGKDFGAVPISKGDVRNLPGQKISGSRVTSAILQPGPYHYAVPGRLNLKPGSASAPLSSFRLSYSPSGSLLAPPLAGIPGSGRHFDSGLGGIASGNLLSGGHFQGAGNAATGNRLLAVFNIGDKETALWTQNVLARIERNWVIPALARVGVPGQVGISLTVDRGGSLLSLRLEKSCNQEELDLAAMNAVKASLPFPPLPADSGGQAFEFHFVFNYNA